MTDVAALRAAHEASLAHRERREVVVVPESLGRFETETVDPHVHPGRTERHVAEHLGLTTGEESRTMDAGRDVDFALDRTDLVLGAAVGALLFDGDRLADRVLFDRVESGSDFGSANRQFGLVGNPGGVLLDHRFLDVGDRLVALKLAGRGDRVDQGLTVRSTNVGEQRFIDGRFLDDELLLANLLAQFLDRGGDLLDLTVGDVKSVENVGLGHAVGAGFDHQDGFVGTGDDQVEIEVLVVFLIRVDHEVTVELADADGTDVLGDRNLGDCQGGGSAVHGEDVVGVFLVDRHRDGHELSLVVPATREERADRTVDHAGGQGCLLAGATFATEE